MLYIFGFLYDLYFKRKRNKVVIFIQKLSLGSKIQYFCDFAFRYQSNGKELFLKNVLHKIQCLTFNLLLFFMASACCSCVVVVHEKRCFNGSQLKLIYLSHLLEIQIYASFILLLIEKLMRSYSYTCHHATENMKRHKKSKYSFQTE